MFVVDPAQNFFRRDAFVCIERDEIILPLGEALEAVHPVVRGREDSVVVAAIEPVVPCGPATSGVRHEGWVGMQGRHVGLVVELAEQATLHVRRMFEQVECLITVTSEDDFVEITRRSIRRIDRYATFRSRHSHCFPSELHPVAKWRDDLGDIRFGAAGDREPRMLRIEPEESVIVPEAEKRHCGKVEHFVRRRAPHRTAHGREITVQHVVAIAALNHVVAQAVIGKVRVFEGRHCLAVEAVDLRKHPPVPWVHQIAPLAEEQVQTSAIVFQPARPVLHAEGHLCRVGRDIQLAEEAGQMRIGDVIENHEPGVDRHLPPFLPNHDRVRVPARVVVLLVEREVEALVQKMCAAETRDAGADDGEGFHGIAWKLGGCFQAPCGFLVNSQGNRLQLPNEPGPGKRVEQVIGLVDRPPREARPRGGHAAVVIVVPALVKSV